MSTENNYGTVTYEQILSEAEKAKDYLEELSPDANWESVINQPLWVIEQLGNVLNSAISIEIIDSFLDDGDLEGFAEWYKKINAITKDYINIRDVYNRYVSQIYLGDDKQ